MNILLSDKLTTIKKENIASSEKHNEKKSISNISNTLVSLYIPKKNNCFLAKVSFFIKNIFNIKQDVTYLLSKQQHNTFNILSKLLSNTNGIDFKNQRLINSDLIRLKCDSIDSFSYSLNIAIKNGFEVTAKKLIEKYLYQYSKTKGDFLTIVKIALDIINSIENNKIEVFKNQSKEISCDLPFNLSHKNNITNFLNYINRCDRVCSESDKFKLECSVMNLVNLIYNARYIEMEKDLIVNIANFYFNKIKKYNLTHYNNEGFKKFIVDLLINKLRNSDAVKIFIDNIIDSKVLNYNDIKVIQKKSKENNGYFLIEFNKEIKYLLKNYSINNEKIISLIRDNYNDILMRISNDPDKNRKEVILLDIIDDLKKESSSSLAFNMNISDFK